MVLSGLALLLGGRADAAVVRVGAERAAARACSCGPCLGGGGARPGRRSRARRRRRPRGAAYGGGRGTVPRRPRWQRRPRAVLAELADDLVTVHGQADQARLRSPRHQRAALDAFAGAEHLGRSPSTAAVGGAAGVAAELDDLERHARTAPRGGAAPARPGGGRAGGPAAGRGRRARGGGGAARPPEDLRAPRPRRTASLAGGDGARRRPVLRPGERRAPGPGAGRAHDPSWRRWPGRLAEVGYLLDDLATELAGYADGARGRPRPARAVHGAAPSSARSPGPTAARWRRARRGRRGRTAARRARRRRRHARRARRGARRPRRRSWCARPRG